MKMKSIRILAFLLAIVMLSAGLGLSRPVLAVDEPETAEASAGAATLVVYFSLTGNTEAIALAVAEETGADVFEVTAKDPYTPEDTEYSPDTRAYREQHDPLSRPEFNETVPDVSGYDTVFIGYPIWHGEAPMILYTFLESVDLGGKTIIPFCTSAESPVGSSAENLSKLSPDAEWRDGTRIEIGASRDEIREWLAGFAPTNAGNGKRVYFASPMFNQGEKDFNLRFAQVLEEYGYEVFLPQRDGLEAALLEGKTEEELISMIFALDEAQVKKADIVFMNLDGRVPDEGACVELGMAYILGKRCYGFMTDTRVLETSLDLNPLISGCMIKIFKNYDGDLLEEEIRQYLSDNEL